MGCLRIVLSLELEDERQGILLPSLAFSSVPIKLLSPSKTGVTHRETQELLRGVSVVLGDCVDSWLAGGWGKQTPSLDTDLLGTPLPNVTHAVSVSMPCWSDVIGYEEGEPAVLEKLQTGYPRFVFHPLVRQLFHRYQLRFTRTNKERAIALATQRAAQRCKEFLALAGFSAVRIESGGAHDVFVVVYPEEAAAVAKLFWQHSGWIVSSRNAAAILSQHEGLVADSEGILRNKLASFAGVAADTITLFPSGMAAIDTAHEVLLSFASERGCVAEGIQFGFPYLDTLKIQGKFGRGVRLLAHADAADLRQLSELAAAGQVSHVFTEVPCNPLLQTPHLEELSQILRPHAIPLVVDDTIGTFCNVDVTPFADLIVTSLTKFVSGRGDVAAGSLIVSPASPLAENLTSHLRAIAPRHSYLFVQDAAVLLDNCLDFPSRMARINSNAEALAAYLSEHPMVQQVYYPKFSVGKGYDAIKKPEGGFGGLLSVVLKDAARTAPRFYDALRVRKGPGLGNSFTLACPYTLLAHYNELDWAEQHGVSRYLIRVSVGVEDPNAMREAFEGAFAAI